MEARLNILTQELNALYHIGLTNTVNSVELDFNLARRSGVMINRIISQIQFQVISASDQVIVAAQELDLDPDNTALLGGHPSIGAPGLNVIDSSRILRHQCNASRNNTGGFAVAGETIMPVSFDSLPDGSKPIAVTNLRVHQEVAGAATDTADFTLSIYYQIVELSLSELGLINASRR